MLVEYHPDDDRGPLEDEGSVLKTELTGHILMLSETIGQRNLENPGSLLRSLAYIKNIWDEAKFSVQSQDYKVGDDVFTNLWIDIPGSDLESEILIVGAHYDTVPETPGADDNATAVAALLSLSVRLKDLKPRRTLRFVAFANEEPPYFMTEDMGSLVYARRCREFDENVIGMICFEMMGYYSDEPGSQESPLEILPDAGNFIAFVGDPNSQKLIESAGAIFREATPFSLVLAALDEAIVPTVAFSDHWSFWQCGWPAFMITDTGPLRNPHYHLPTDTIETLNLDHLTVVTQGVKTVIERIANKSEA